MKTSHWFLFYITLTIGVLVGMVWAIDTLMDGQRQSVYHTDLKLNRELYKECMAVATNGPKSVVYNDWAEVVESCQTWAHNNSSDYYCVKNCDPTDKPLPKLDNPRPVP